MVEFHKIWLEQCQAACGIRENFGVKKALGYLIGEKLVNFVKEAADSAEFRRELPDFVAEIKRMFSQPEIVDYLDSIKRIGAPAHVLTDEQYALFEESRAISESPAEWAEGILIVERIMKLLLE